MTITLAVLGDSIAYGQGASRTEDTIGPRLVTALAAAGTEATLRVFAVPGADSRGLAAQASAAAQWSPSVAVVVIGANDLARFVPAQRAAFRLADAVKVLRTAGSQVVVVPAPDLSVVPWVPAQLRGLVSAGSTQLRELQSQAALSEGARVADAEGRTAPRFAVDRTLFSADRFHPSSAGYAVIVEALAPAVLAAAADASDGRSRSRA